MSRRRKRTILMWVIMVLTASGLVLLISSTPNKPLDDVDGIFEASATILAFVSLGSVLGVRFNRNITRSRRQFGGIIVVLVFSATVIIIQTAIMLGLCCFGLNTHTYAILMILTAIGFILMIFGYLIYIIGQLDLPSSS